MKLLIALIAVIFIFYISCLDWRRSVKAALVILVLEGALRKWVLPQASEMIYFLKDVVLFGAYFQYYGLSKGGQKFPTIKTPFINILLGLVFGWCMFLSFNPSLGSVVVGIWGLKNYFYYVPLMWMLPNLFQSEEELYRFLRTHLLLVIPVGILGIVQYFSPASSPLNVYAPGQEATTGIATFGVSHKVRITGTFSYVNNYTAYLLVCFGLLISFLSIEQPKWWKRATIIELLLVIGNSLMTGSRTPVIAAGLLTIGYFGTKIIAQPSRFLRLVKLFFPPALVVAVGTSIVFHSALENFSRRASAGKDVIERIMLGFAQPLQGMQFKGLDAYGPGAVHPATVVLRRGLGLPYGEIPPVEYESELGRIMLEIGPLGFILWYGLKFAIVIKLWLIFWKLRPPFLRELALAAFLIQAVWSTSGHVFQVTFSMYYWFLSGFIYLLPYLENVENWRQQQRLELYEELPYLPSTSNRKSECS